MHCVVLTFLLGTTGIHLISFPSPPCRSIPPCSQSFNIVSWCLLISAFHVYVIAIMSLIPAVLCSKYNYFLCICVLHQIMFFDFHLVFYVSITNLISTSARKIDVLLVYFQLFRYSINSIFLDHLSQSNMPYYTLDQLLSQSAARLVFWSIPSLLFSCFLNFMYSFTPTPATPFI